MDVLDWLLDADPSIRWQVLRDLADAAPAAIAAERARVAHVGWGSHLLDLQGADGNWEGGALFPARDGVPLPWSREEGQPWTATAPTLELLRELGADPADPRVRGAISMVEAHTRWEHDRERFFDGEVEPCLNGATIAVGAYFGVDVAPVVERLLGEQLEDGGWNCEAEFGSVRSSFHTTIRVLDGLLAFEQAVGAQDHVTAVRRRGEGYLLERHLLRRLSTDEIVDPAYLECAFPVRWRFDALRGLDYFRRAGDAPDPRLAEAIDLLRSKRRPDGTWPLDRVHKGATNVEPERVGEPSRWITLRALRVLRWVDESAG
jgi:hypothetical protein